MEAGAAPAQTSELRERLRLSEEEFAMDLGVTSRNGTPIGALHGVRSSSTKIAVALGEAVRDGGQDTLCVLQI